MEQAWAHRGPHSCGATTLDHKHFSLPQLTRSHQVSNFYHVNLIMCWLLYF